MACLGAVVGMTIERAILRARSPAFRRPADLWILTAGASAARAELLTETLISRGATAVMSFGIAGGLDPALRPGGLVLAREVISPEGLRLPADAAWRDRVATTIHGRPVHDGAIAGTDQMLISIEQKADLHRRTRAAAADMESHGVARAAVRRSIPFLVVRAVADPADRALPRSAVAGLDDTGAVRPAATLAAIISNPAEIAALLGVAATTWAALLALWHCVGDAGPALAG